MFPDDGLPTGLVWFLFPVMEEEDRSEMKEEALELQEETSY